MLRVSAVLAPASLMMLLWTGLAGCRAVAPPMAARWEPLRTGTKANLRGLHVLSGGVVWASGSAGTVVRSVDGGATVEAHVVPDAQTFELRDIHGFDAQTAYFIACQPARIYRTVDGARTFELVHTVTDDAAFLDGLAFFDRQHGVAFGDPVGDRLLVLTTADGGNSWQPVPAANLPRALPGEGGFAASGTCLAVQQDGRAFIATGIAGARVFHSKDFGRTWGVVATRMRYGESAGIFSLAFRDARHGVAVGGDYKATANHDRNAAWTDDGGASWHLVASQPPRGFRSCVAYLPGGSPTQVAPTLVAPTLVAIGEQGADYSTDDGHSWHALRGATDSDVGYHAVGFAADGGGVGFAVGAAGRMARLELSRGL